MSPGVRVALCTVLRNLPGPRQTWGHTHGSLLVRQAASVIWNYKYTQAAWRMITLNMAGSPRSHTQLVSLSEPTHTQRITQSRIETMAAHDFGTSINTDCTSFFVVTFPAVKV